MSGQLTLWSSSEGHGDAASTDRVRRTAAFKELVQELKLVDFWRTRGWPTYCRALGNDDFECF